MYQLHHGPHVSGQSQNQIISASSFQYSQYLAGALSLIFSCYGSVKGSSLSQRPRSRSCWLNSELPGRELKKDRASKRSFKECTWVRATLPWQFGSFNHATRSPMGRPWPSRPSMADSLIVRLRRQSLLWSECTVQCAVIRPSR